MGKLHLCTYGVSADGKVRFGQHGSGGIQVFEKRYNLFQRLKSPYLSVALLIDIYRCSKEFEE